MPLFCVLALLIIVSALKGNVGESVTQTEGTVTITEGDHVALNCTYETSYSAFPFWYIQQPSQPPRLLLDDFGGDSSSTDEVNLGFKAKHDKEKKTFNMVKIASRLSDSAVYFCALSDINGGKVDFGGGTFLQVNPKLEPSDPSVYQLQSPKEGDRDISACLITDFFPTPIRVGADGIDEHEVNGSIIIVKESGKETPSYGEVIWGKSKEAEGCYAEQNNNRFPSESAEAATTYSEKTTGGFETDERLNLLSLTVLGLRVIFLKCVAFNLLLTFHAWSS